MKGVFGKTLVGRREAFDVHKKEILTTSSRSVQDSFSVRLIGLEPTRREAPDPKSGPIDGKDKLQIGYTAIIC